MAVMPDETPEIRTQSAVLLFLLLLVAIAMPFIVLLLLVASAAPVIPWKMILAGGAGLAILLGMAQFVLSRRTARALGYKLGALDVPRASQSAELMVEADAERLGAAVKQALQQVNVTHLQVDGRKISGVSKVSWSSWGEHVQVQISPVDERRTLLVISSKPAMPTNFIDHGRNLRNVTQVCRTLREMVAAGSAPR